MLQFCELFLFVYLISSTFCTPIFNSEDVGAVLVKNKNVVVTGQTLYPYIVHVQIFYTNEKGQRRSQYCAGVIIGDDTVLTAGHCFYKKVNVQAVIHAGIVDLKWEKNDGQKIKMKDHLVHKNYQEECVVGKQDCVQLNDIGIVWTLEKFRIGTNIKIATLSKDITKPAGKEGYILGWGLDENNKVPSMLQRGLVKVLSRAECKKFTSAVYYPYTVMCLAPVSGKTRACHGDSGGPFVIDGVVYGISSITLFDSPRCTNTMDLYTYVAAYSGWIDLNWQLGPPKERPRKPLNSADTIKRQV